jgi:hypothetical protein
VRIDDELWARWQGKHPDLPDAAHLDKENTVRFVSRAVTAELTPELAYSDVKSVLDFLLQSDDALAAAGDLISPVMSHEHYGLQHRLPRRRSFHCGIL